MAPHFVLICAALLLGTAHSIPDLDRTGLQEAVAASKETVVYFYTEWCGLCQEFDTIYSSIAADLQIDGELQFVKFNAGKDRPFAAPLVEDAYPGLAVFHGEQLAGTMNGIKTRATVETWLSQSTGDPVVLAKSMEEAMKIAKRFRVSFISTIPSLDSDSFKFFIDVANSHRHWARWIAVIDSEISKPVVSIKHPYEKPKSLEFESPAELLNWCDEHRLPLFGEMDATNQKEYYNRGKNPIVFASTLKAFKEHGLMFRKLAVQFKELFSFVWFRSDQQGAHQTLTGMMIRKTPNFAVFTGTGKSREHKRFVYPESNELNFDDISQYLKLVMDKKVRPTVQSMPNPSKAVLDSRKVKPVSGDLFEDLVLHANKDFMLVLTAPKGNEVFEGCTRCEPLLRMLEEMAPVVEERLEKERLGFGEFLVTANEIPMFNWGGSWQLEELPVIYLVKANTSSPIEFKGPFNSSSILNFWESQTEFKDVKEKKLSKSIEIESEVPAKKKDEL